MANLGGGTQMQGTGYASDSYGFKSYPSDPMYEGSMASSLNNSSGDDTGGNLQTPASAGGLFTNQMFVALVLILLLLGYIGFNLNAEAFKGKASVGVK